LSLDSRRLASGSLFIALPGTRGHGLDYLQQAVDAGCVAVVAEIDCEWSRERIEALNTSIPVIAAGNVHAGSIAARFYADPSAQLTIIGYTGTNGKTTCAWLTAGVLENCAMIGTLGNGVPGSLQQATHTTPDAISLQQMFADYLQTGITAVAMEVSSHALDQERVDGAHIDVAVFTNLSRDHLDYHDTMQAYAEAKKKLFRLPGLSCVVINMDDPYGQQIMEDLDQGMRCITVGVNSMEVQLRASHIRQTQQGLKMLLHYEQQQVVLESPLIGRFNVDNLLSVTGALLAAGVPLVQALKRLSSVPAVPGRMERFGGENQPLVVVDYAHTPDALKNALLAAREHTDGELICLFGCGGDRDQGKRPLMGAVAEELADRVIVTDDNPRSESGDAIIEQILCGMKHPSRVVRDRQKAISIAITQASAGDLVLVAGKGHEDVQIIGDQRHHFSDREVVAKLLGSRQ
ncbi:MAG TPA: UDP-N-acetylmuramoyl-L-alanyl-D-glutamate--2,6-diaminopimelate ligase, partial [Gammaproteobacteria bacterium]|nr:UDP-N-acetylmuramoyl-L-alanyl-D-glutamate--2,6-diaminopimelate ligase [Gammaproteobacteria bacterium]